MTTAEAVEALDDIDQNDPEAAHITADDILLASVDPAVREAYEALVDRSRWWACA